MVKDFAVVNDPKRLVFIGPGLVSQGEIDDASPAMAKDRIFVKIKSTAIRPTMANRARHSFDDGLGAGFAQYVHITSDTTH